MWEIHIQHKGLAASRLLKGQTYAEAQTRADRQTLLWDQRWAQLQAARLAQTARSTPQRLRIHGAVIANRLTAEAAARSTALNSLLESSLSSGPFFHWDMLKDHTLFSGPAIAPARVLPPPQRPKKTRSPLSQKLIPSLRTRNRTSAVHRFDSAIAAWRTACLEVTEINRAALAETQCLRDRRAIQKKHHDVTQLAQHASVATSHTQFLHHDQHAVEYFFSEVLSRSPYPLGFPRETNLHYVPSTRDLLVEYELPSITAWPTFKEIRYNPVRCTLHHMPVSELWTAISYEDALYQLPLRVLSELFAHDDAQTLDRISFNGWVRAVDKSTGNLAHQCMMSIQVTRAAFSAINLARVDPAACFKKLKGMVCRDLAEPESVEPLMFFEMESEPFLRTNNFFRSGPQSNLVSIDRRLLAQQRAQPALPNEA